MNSMTGYGKGECEFDNNKVIVELKSVNHRFLDLSFKLPRALGFAEDTLRNYIKATFTRGHIDVFVNFAQKGVEEDSVSVNYPLVDKYMQLASELAARYDIPNDMTVSKIFERSSIIVSGDNVFDEKTATAALLEATKIACDNLQKMRAIEGENIKVNLMEKVDGIDTVTHLIEEFVPTQLENFKTKLRVRIQEALGEIQLDEQRLQSEIVFYADRVAIDEEFIRLYAHIKHFKEIANGSEPVGRQLDFIVQELNREANTIGSKCNDLSLANYVLQMKTDIEKVREQVQNIE